MSTRIQTQVQVECAGCGAVIVKADRPVHLALSTCDRCRNTLLLALREHKLRPEAQHRRTT